MQFEIVLGIPDVETYWNELDNKYKPVNYQVKIKLFLINSSNLSDC
jgi:hypothetical protein